MATNIRREITDDNICVLTFDRPDSSANIFDVATLTQLEAHIDGLAAKPPKGLIFMSAKPAIFIAGADLHALNSLREDELKSFIKLGQGVFNKIAALAIPTVAAIHGACLGGGYEMCLACDYRIATPDRATRIGLPETKLGILPAWGGSTRLPKLIGAPRALDIILGGKTPGAKQALRLGLVDQVAPREWLLRAARRVIREGVPRRGKGLVRWVAPVSGMVAGMVAPRVRAKLRKKTRGHYPALYKALDVVTAAASSWNPEESFRRERQAVIELAGTSECRNLLRVFWMQERAKKLSIPGAQEAGAATAADSLAKSRGLPAVSRVAVIGAGVMGAGITQWLTSRRLHVLLRDIDAERVATGIARIARLYAEGVKRRLFDKLEARDGMDRVSPSAEEVPLRDIQLVLEAAVEKMDLKKKIFARLDQVAPPEAILATNTSALSISDLATATSRPERVVGIHFFNPVHQMQLVEVVRGAQTSDETVQRAVQFVQKIGKLPVVVRDSPGFLVNRILLPYLVEAVQLFAMGAGVENIDEAMLDFGMPMGPLRLLDEVGLDVATDVAATLASSFPERMHVPETLNRMIEAGMQGRKSGGGFYSCKNGDARPNPAAEKFREADAAAGVERPELQRRMVLLMINEAARCLEEGIVADASDVDFGMIMGTGFAPFTGGPLRLADAEGAKAVWRELNEKAEVAGPHYTPCDLIRRMAESGERFYADR